MACLSQAAMTMLEKQNDRRGVMHLMMIEWTGMIGLATICGDS